MIIIPGPKKLTICGGFLGPKKKYFPKNFILGKGLT